MAGPTSVKARRGRAGEARGPLAGDRGGLGAFQASGLHATAEEERWLAIWGTEDELRLNAMGELRRRSATFESDRIEGEAVTVLAIRDQKEAGSDLCGSLSIATEGPFPSALQNARKDAE